jgi:phage/plasmid-like protein (TIGR03299 family)
VPPRSPASRKHCVTSGGAYRESASRPWVTVIDEAANSREAIRLARLDWTVEQWPITAANPTTWATSKVDDFVANVRTDTQAVLGVVGCGYHVFQNRDAFDFMDAIVGDKLAMYETAGALKGGRRVWMLAAIPKEYRAGPEDLIKPYVLLVNSHDGSAALRMIPTTVRVVCQNTLNLALGQAAASEGISIRHRPSLDGRVKEARDKLGIVAARFDRFDEELHAMLDRHMKPLQLERYFDGVLPPLPRDASERQQRNRKQTVEQFHTNFNNDTNTLPGVRGTAWAAYNAVSEWADHERQFRGGNDRQRAENRLSSVWFGSSAQIKQRAYGQALELAGGR